MPADITEAQERIKGCYSAIRRLKSELSAPEKLDADLQLHRSRIQWHQSEIDRIEEILICGQDRIKTLYDEIADARKTLDRAQDVKRENLLAELARISAELQASGGVPKT